MGSAVFDFVSDDGDWGSVVGIAETAWLSAVRSLSAARPHNLTRTSKESVSTHRFCF
jgi:hypothetical protein